MSGLINGGWWKPKLVAPFSAQPMHYGYWEPLMVSGAYCLLGGKGGAGHVGDELGFRGENRRAWDLYQK